MIPATIVFANQSQSLVPGAISSNRMPLLDHPIRRLHDHLLQAIFEATTRCSRNGLKQATSISHVSQHWRSLAISTPTIWGHIQVSDEAIAAFWERMSFRVKDIPPTVYTLDIDNELDLKDVLLAVSRLGLCPLNQFRNITTLTVKGNELGSSSCVAPSTSFNHLPIRVKVSEEVNPWDATVSAHFPGGLRHLALEDADKPTNGDVLFASSPRDAQIDAI